MPIALLHLDYASNFASVRAAGFFVFGEMTHSTTGTGRERGRQGHSVSIIGTVM